MIKIRYIFIFLIALLATILPSMSVFAANTVDVTITAIPTYVSMSNAPTVYSLGIIAPGGIVTGSTAYFACTNTGTVPGNITILVTSANWTGLGSGWIHSDTATAGPNTIGLRAGTQDHGNTTAVIVKTTSSEFINNLANANHSHWGLSVYSPTSFSDGFENRIVLRLTIVQA